MEDIHIKCQGFHPSEFTNWFLNTELKAVYNEAPGDSTLRAMFTRKSRDFKGVVRIQSSAGTFIGVASGRRLKDVTRKVTEQLRRQIDKWRKLRFNHQSIKHLPLKTEDVGYDKDTVA
jgi:hypothetical protein